MKEEAQSVADLSAFVPAAEARRYAAWAFLSAAIGTFTVVTAGMGTKEFFGLVFFHGLIFGFLPAVGAGLLAVLAVVVSGGLMRWLAVGCKAQNGVFCFWALLPIVAALVMVAATSRSGSRLESVLRAPVPGSVRGAKVAGFSGSLDARWYAQFSASSNDIVGLAQANRLTNSSNLVAWEQIVSDTFLQSSGLTNLPPVWKPARLLSRFMKDNNYPTQSGGWVLMFVDETGTNVFFHRGFQD